MARFRARLSPVVGCLLAINVGIFIVILVLDRFYRFEAFAQWFALVPALAVRGRVWQLVTYMFLHDPGGLTHILFNMYILFSFGPHVESVMQPRRFLSLYLFSGLMAGVAHTALAYSHPVLGASGAILGVMAAFAFYYPNARVLLLFIIPVRARNLVWVAAGIDLFIAYSGGSRIAAFAHLGGLFTGVLFVRYDWLVYRKVAEHQSRWHNNRERSREDARMRVDELLEKIHRHPDGINGLTFRERFFLKRFSSRYKKSK